MDNYVEYLEFFTGLILFSDAGTTEKIEYMFSLYDFNEEQSLARRDFEYLVYCCITSTCKLHNLSTEEVRPETVEDIIKDSFGSSKENYGHRITLKQIL